MRTKYVNLLAVALSVATSVVGVALSGSLTNSAMADESRAARAVISVSPICSITADVTTPHVATLAPGVYSSTTSNYTNGIGSTTLTTFCNDTGGYAIYAIGYTGDTDGTNTMVGEATGLAIATGTATSGDASQWAMKISKVYGDSTYNPNNLAIDNGFGSFHVVPSSYTKVATYTSQTDSVLGSKVTATYAVYIQPAQAADTYTGKVKYTLVHPNTNDPDSFIVNFYANGGTGTMNSQKIARDSATALSTNAFTAPAGKMFIGWNTALDGSGTTYTNQQQVTNLASAGETITLYAQWKEPNQSSCTSSPYISTVASGVTYMQDINSTNRTTILSNLTEEATYQIKDSRDNTTYCVSKLSDGNLWLLDNLALDLTDENVQSAMYNSTDTKTNASYQTLGYLFGYSTAGASSKYATGAVSTTWGVSYSAPRIYIASRNSVNSNDSLSDDAKTWKYGIYYNYCAVSAGSYCYGDASSGNTTEDICPAGWHMPSGATQGNYNNLRYSGSTYRAALHLPLSGYAYNTSPSEQESCDDWWSTTRNNDNSMYYLSVCRFTVSPKLPYGYRGRGYSARCILSS